MSDPRNVLQSLFAENHRFVNFGEVLMRMHVQGIRCHESTLVEVASPITAFCGFNGTGKSTLLQLASAAYRAPILFGRYYIKSFIVAGVLDANPFRQNATVKYEYQNPPSSSSSRLKPVTISRKRSKWGGYKRQPQRRVYLAGMGLYLPRVEERDFVTRNSNNIVVENTQPVSSDTQLWIKKILGVSYEEISANAVKHGMRKAEVVTVGRNGCKYSEANMGCGEGRVQHIVRVLETLPEKSFVLLEEPETSLHPSAQHGFGAYLLDVCIRKRHQVWLTTHSEYLMSALPTASRIYLARTAIGIKQIAGLTPLQAVSLMAQGNVKALHVLVEDDCAKAILREMIRQCDLPFLQTLDVHSVGDADTVARTVRALKETGLPVAAVRDGDKGATPADNIFKLPGTLPPEKELFANQSVKNHIIAEYGVSLDDFATGLMGVNHHDWFCRLSSHLNKSEEALVAEAAKAYVQSLPEAETTTIIQLLKAASSR